MPETNHLCPDDAIAQLAELAGRDTEQGLRRADVLLLEYDEDPRLYFLRGSLLAALQRYGEAEKPMREAIEIAPDFHIARFQLGLLLLTSGDADKAAEIWGPLSRLDSDDALRLFAEGLQHMARDEFKEAEALLLEGLARNQAHPPLNADMRMVLDRMRETAAQPPPPPSDGASSEAHWLLQVSAAKQTKH
jgi:tetratricopeptide (TPR) repeat protein